jgi:hypothetical protein
MRCLEKLKLSIELGQGNTAVENIYKKRAAGSRDKSGTNASNSALMEMRYVQDMNAQLLKLKQKVLTRFAECIVQRI